MTDGSSASASPAKEVSVSQVVNAPADRTWSMISDVTRMGEWSPETTSCSWLKGATEPAVGARFKGNNTNGKKKWSTTCVVTQCEPAKSFVFEVSAGPLKISRWAYGIDSTDGGQTCTVTETWTDQRGSLVTKLGKPLSGVENRSVHNRESMVATLAALATAATQS